MGERSPHLFHCDNVWSRDDSYEETVVKGWADSNNPSLASLVWVAERLGHMQQTLRKWSANKFGNVKKKMRKARVEFEKERNRALYRGPSNPEKQLAANMAELLRQEEVMANQRSRVDWLKEGDRNTAFFPAKASARKRRNIIQSLKDDMGRVCMEKEEVKDIVKSFYSNLFNVHQVLDEHAITQFVPAKVTEVMDRDLCRAYEDFFFLKRENKFH
jgi:hypothetical protein